MTNTKTLTWIGGGASLAAILAAGTLAFWPASETDKARDDGKAFGTAVAALRSATTPVEVDAALVDVRDATASTRDHMTDEVSEQIDEQTDALERAADGVAGERASTDDFSQDVYHAELDTAIDDLARQADEFRTQGPELRQAFWEGYQDGLA